MAQSTPLKAALLNTFSQALRAEVETCMRMVLVALRDAAGVFKAPP